MREIDRKPSPSPQTVLNGRSLTRRQPTGVDQLPALMASHMGDSHSTHVARPRGGGRGTTNIWEQIALPWIARRSVLVSLANSGPAIARRHVVMIHDVSPWDHPEWFSRPYRLKATLLARAWARWSSLVLTPSQFSADRCAAVFGIAPSRLMVVGNAHRWGLTPPNRVESDQPYVLTVSTLSARKNLAYLLEAWPLVRKQYPELRLRVVGARASSLLVGDDGGSAIDDSSVDYLGYVEEDELDRLTVGATALVSASRYEGFNIPVLDALVVGVPVAVSDIPVHRELYGEGGQFFDLEDTTSFVRGLTLAIERGVTDSVRDAYRDRFSPNEVVERIHHGVSRRFESR